MENVVRVAFNTMEEVIVDDAEEVGDDWHTVTQKPSRLPRRSSASSRVATGLNQQGHTEFHRKIYYIQLYSSLA